MKKGRGTEEKREERGEDPAERGVREERGREGRRGRGEAKLCARGEPRRGPGHTGQSGENEGQLAKRGLLQVLTKREWQEALAVVPKGQVQEARVVELCCSAVLWSCKQSLAVSKVLL